MVAKNRRTLYLIEPYKQLRFGIMFIATNIIFAVLLVFVFSFYLWDIFEAVNEYFKLSHSEELVTASKFVQPLGLSLGLVVLFILSTLYLSAHYTHQLYGPLVSIRRFLDDLLAGKKPRPIKLRTGDQLHDLVDRLNNLTDLSKSEASSSLGAITHFTDELLAGREPDVLKLPDTDPLKALSMKLNRLAKDLQAKK